MSSLAELISLVSKDGISLSAEVNLIIINNFVCIGKVVFFCPVEMRRRHWWRWTWFLKCCRFTQIGKNASFGWRDWNSFFGGDNHKTVCISANFACWFVDSWPSQQLITFYCLEDFLQSSWDKWNLFYLKIHWTSSFSIFLGFHFEFQISVYVAYFNGEAWITTIG